MKATQNRIALAVLFFFAARIPRPPHKPRQPSTIIATKIIVPGKTAGTAAEYRAFFSFCGAVRRATTARPISAISLSRSSAKAAASASSRIWISYLSAPIPRAARIPSSCCIRKDKLSRRSFYIPSKTRRSAFLCCVPTGLRV